MYKSSEIRINETLTHNLPSSELPFPWERGTDNSLNLSYHVNWIDEISTDCWWVNGLSLPHCPLSPLSPSLTDSGNQLMRMQQLYAKKNITKDNGEIEELTVKKTLFASSLLTRGERRRVSVRVSERVWVERMHFFLFMRRINGDTDGDTDGDTLSLLYSPFVGVRESLIQYTVYHCHLSLSIWTVTAIIDREFRYAFHLSLVKGGAYYYPQKVDEYINGKKR